MPLAPSKPPATTVCSFLRPQLGDSGGGGHHPDHQRRLTWMAILRGEKSATMRLTPWDRAKAAAGVHRGGGEVGGGGGEGSESLLNLFAQFI